MKKDKKLSAYFSFEEVLDELRVNDFEFLKYIVKNGVQPCKKSGKPVPSPDVRSAP